MVFRNHPATEFLDAYNYASLYNEALANDVSQYLFAGRSWMLIKTEPTQSGIQM